MAARENIQLEFCKHCLPMKFMIKCPTIFYDYTPVLWIMVKTLIFLFLFFLETIWDLGIQNTKHLTTLNNYRLSFCIIVLFISWKWHLREKWESYNYVIILPSTNACVLCKNQTSSGFKITLNVYKIIHIHCRSALPSY